MKNDKICVRKNLMYLFLISVFAVLFVVTVNYINSQQKGTSSKAANKSCVPTAANIDANGCELRQAITDHLSDGTYNKSPSGENTGMICQDMGEGRYELKVDIAQCPPTKRCSYGGLVYLKQFNGADTYDVTDGNYCIKDSGYQCVESADGLTFRTKPNADCGAVVTPVCKYAGTTVTDSSTPYKYDADFCIVNASGVKMGAYCQNSSGDLVNGNAKNAAAGTTCAAPVSATGCSYGGKVITTSTTPYKIDADNCVVNATTGLKVGAICPANGNAKNAAVGTTCAATTAPITTCSYGGKLVTTTSTPYHVDAEGCVLNSSDVKVGAVCVAGVANAKTAAAGTTCAAPVASATCTYSGVKITTSSTPNKYVAGTFCIVNASGVNVGAYCPNDGTNLVTGNAKVAAAGTACAAPASACNPTKYTSTNFSCQSGWGYGIEKTNTFGVKQTCCCDAAGKYSYPTIQATAKCM